MYSFQSSTFNKGDDMGRSIILLSDGTGNGAAKQNKTNVWRLYDALNLHRKDQLAFYDDGVGSQEFLPLKLLGGAFGYGLKANVRQLYKFLCHNYRPEDRIYMFGFSRGAFTMRMLTGMLDSCGVCTEFDSEQELERIARHNYNAYRSKFESGLLTRLIRLHTGVSDPHPNKKHITPEIEFIGLWDTVDAYGFPFDGLAWLWDKLIYPMYFPNYKLSKLVKKACHALSIDDERKTFHPVLWDESEDYDKKRIEQVWFPGVHSDVGGGYPEYTLALVALDWMVSKVEAENQQQTKVTGLHFISGQREAIHCHSDWHGKQHDSRSLFGAYYRYSPRDIETLCNSRIGKVHIGKPKIHRSVFERIRANVVPYAPTGMSADYEVVGFEENVERYEVGDEAQQRHLALTKVKPVIFARQCLYFAMLVTTFLYLRSPWTFKCFEKDTCTGTGGLFDRGFVFIMNFLPDFTVPWIRVLRDQPWLLYLLITIFGIFFFLKSRLWIKTQVLANAAWAKLKLKGRKED